MCLQNTLLTCRSNTCQCPLGVGWFWSPDYLRCIQCPYGWTILSGRCYYYVNNSPQTWNAAQTYCSNLYRNGHLIIVNSQDEMNLLNQVHLIMGNGIWVSEFFAFIQVVIAIIVIILFFKIGAQTYSVPRNWLWTDGSSFSSTSSW